MVFGYWGDLMKFTVDFKYELDGFGVTQFTDINTSRERLPGEIQKWIHKIRMKNGYRDLTIKSITVNGTEDVTEEIKNTPPQF